MNKTLNFVASAAGLVFVAIGILWLVLPDVAGAQLGMTLLTGAGLTSQVANLASFFLTLGGCILIGLVTGNPVWFVPSIMLLSFAVIGRLIAWQVHDGALTGEMILVEVVVSLVLIGVVKTRKDAG